MNEVQNQAPYGDGPARPGTVYRWLCHCQEPPVLLGTWEPNGRINIKVRDRYWHIFGQVETTCPRCGAAHILDGMNPPRSTPPKRS